MDDKILEKYKRKLLLEAMVKAVVFGLSFGFGAGLLVAVISLSAGFLYGFVIAFAVFPIVSAFAGWFTYRKYFKLSQKHVYARVDGLGLEERVITAMELKDDDSFIARKLREDTSEKLTKITPQKLKLKFKKWPFAMLAAVGVVSLVLMSFSAGTAAAEFSRLAPPSGFAYHQYTKQITWNAVENASSGYQATVRLEGSNSVALSVDIAQNTTEKPQLDVTALSAGRYVLSVYAKESGRNRQSETATFAFRVLSAQEEIMERMLDALRKEVAETEMGDMTRNILSGYIDALSSGLSGNDSLIIKVARIIETAEHIHALLDGSEFTDIVFESNNGWAQDVTLRRRPAATGLNKNLHDIIDGALEGLGYSNTASPFRISDIPLRPRNHPPFRVFAGWALKDTVEVLTNEEILEAVANEQFTFVAIWFDDDELIARMLAELRRTINSATVAQNLKSMLLGVVDDLEDSLSGMSTIRDKVEAIEDAAQEIRDIFASFPIVDIVFDSNNDADETVTITKKQPDFRRSDIPDEPATAPEYLYFWGWASVNDPDTILTDAEILEEVANGNYNFIAVWGDSEPDEPEPDDAEDSDDESDSEDLEQDIEDIIEDVLDQLEEMEGEEENGAVIPPNEPYIGENIINGETPYTDVFDQFYKDALELLTSGNLSPEMAQIIEQYFNILNRG